MDDLSIATLSFWSSLTADEQAEFDAKIAAREAVFTAEINRVRDAVTARYERQERESIAAFEAALKRGDELRAAADAALRDFEIHATLTPETVQQLRAAIAKAVQP